MDIVYFQGVRQEGSWGDSCHHDTLSVLILAVAEVPRAGANYAHTGRPLLHFLPSTCVQATLALAPQAVSALLLLLLKHSNLCISQDLSSKLVSRSSMKLTTELNAEVECSELSLSSSVRSMEIVQEHCSISESAVSLSRELGTDWYMISDLAPDREQCGTGTIFFCTAVDVHSYRSCRVRDPIKPLEMRRTAHLNHAQNC